jgi:hypothetical protein
MTNAVNLSALGSNGGTSVSTWTTGTRPASPLTGQTGFNTTLGSLESYNGSAWVSGGGLNLQAVQTTGFTAVAGNIYPCNTTSAAFTVTLPASPTAGNQIAIVDYAGTFNTNNLTVNPNSLKINGLTSNAILTVNYTSVLLVYLDSTRGWTTLSSSAATPGNALSQSYAISYLIVAGGGGGGQDIGGGGGAGGLLTSTSSLIPGTTYSFTVGAGGVNNTVGNNSTGLGLTALGGGGGFGGAGGSGGGSRGSGGGTAGAGTAGQGNNGSSSTQSSGAGSGGGGGAGAAGGIGNNSASGNGGVGLANSITGSSVFYAGGGGGGGYSVFSVAAGSGGNGGGANGLQSGTPSAATANLGGGGGGGGVSSNGGAGGSGVVILSVPTANYSGTTTGSPTITTSGSNTIIKFNASGSYTA